jgi:hypothetical protein
LFSLQVEVPVAKKGAAKKLLHQLQQHQGGSGLALAEARADGVPSLGAALLLPGEVVELSALPGAGALSLAFHLLRQLQEKRGGQAPWLCALQPEGEILNAPALLHLGISLTRLLVLTPPAPALARLAVRITRSANFAGIIVDATASPSLAQWPVAVRRLSLAARAHGTGIFLLTRPRVHRPLPLPTAARAHCRSVKAGLSVSLVKHRGGWTGHEFLLPHLFAHPALEGEGSA